MSSRCSISFDIDSEKDLLKLQKMLQSERLNKSLNDVLNGGGKEEIAELICDLDNNEIPDAILEYLRKKLDDNYVSLELLNREINEKD